MSDQHNEIRGKNETDLASSFFKLLIILIPICVFGQLLKSAF